jgi:hypothetical protein
MASWMPTCLRSEEPISPKPEPPPPRRGALAASRKLL